ncbi:MAG: TIGR03915 family putative DNA repair protein [Lachnospiraceae bacterium]|nr:TIGR03915 family putative DNA repair protein [Lachnospiraceae bacterium]
MTVYVCEPSFEGILCGVYDAWMSRKGHENVRLEIDGAEDMELFCQYEKALVTEEKTGKVSRAIRQKLSERVYEQVYMASLSRETGRADVIYRFLIDGFRYGSRILEMLHLPSVYELFQLCRFVGNESHYLKEFIRFSRMSDGVLLSRIGPKNDVLPYLAVHFADRMPSENWMIYDENRRRAVVHPAEGEWFLLREDEQMWRERMEWKTDEEEYQSLWKTFCRTTAIPERKNERCQRNHLPLRYRPYMTEFT